MMPIRMKQRQDIRMTQRNELGVCGSACVLLHTTRSCILNIPLNVTTAIDDYIFSKWSAAYIV